jgi:type I restriction enzyme, S subunit
MNECRRVLLDDIVLLIERGSRPRGGASRKEGIWSLGGEHLNRDGGFVWNRPKFISDEYFLNMKKGIVKNNCILMVKDGATTGKVSFVDKNRNFPIEQAAINEHLFQLTIDSSQAVPKYVFYYLYSHRGQKDILRNFRGATVGGIGLDFPRHIKIPLPSVVEQQKVVQILDEAKELCDLNQQLTTCMKKMFYSVFWDFFGDPVINKKQWKMMTLEDVLSNMQTGWSPVCEKRQPQTDEWGVLKLSALTHGFFDVSECKTLPQRTLPKSKTKLKIQNGDVLFSRKNTFDYIGSTVHVFGLDDSSKYIFSDLMFRMQTNSHLMHPIFLWLCLSQKNQRLEIRRIATGTAGTMPNISKKRLLSMPIICPPLPLQHRFASIIEEICDMKDIQHVGLLKSHKIFEGLLQQYFTKGVLEG